MMRAAWENACGLVKASAGAFGSLLFPAHCAACGGRVGDRQDFCASCAEQIEWIREPRCETCSQPFFGKLAAAFVCPNCRGEPFHFEFGVATARSAGPIRDMIHRLKYGGEMWLARMLGAILAEGFRDARLVRMEFDAIVPVPLHPKRLRERGFNQSELLARELSRRCGIPVRALIRRRRYTTTQTELGRRERMRNLREALVLRKGVDVQDGTFLLVDDVLTTGSTLDACAAALVEAGASRVCALTVARG